MRKRLFGAAIFTVLFLSTAIFVAAWHFSSMLLRPRPLECSKEHFLYCADPSELGVSFSDVEFEASDGLTIRGWFVPAHNSSKGVILAHGRAGDRRAGLRWVKALHRAGFNLLLLDFRGAGKSDKFVNTMGYHEKKDLIAAVEFVTNEKRLSSVGIFGVSQGGACAILAMAEDKRIRAGVFEASFASAVDIIAEIGERDFYLPRYPLIPLVFWFYEFRGKFDVVELNMEPKIAAIAPRPVYLIHCRDDNYTSYRHAERLFSAAGDPKNIWAASCVHHGRAWQSDPNRAESIVTKFYRDNL